jgi:hypothetical protein
VDIKPNIVPLQISLTDEDVSGVVRMIKERMSGGVSDQKWEDFLRVLKTVEATNKGTK